MQSSIRRRNFVASLLPTRVSRALVRRKMVAALAAGDVRDRDYLALAQLVEGGVLPRDLVAFDVGANIGQTAIDLRLAISESQIFAFEPNPALGPQLEDLARRLGSCQVETLGFGQAEGSMTMYVPVYRRFTLSALASLSRDAAAQVAAPGSPYVPAFDRRAVRLETREVAIRTLDAWVAEQGVPPDFVKVDAESHEPEILRGARETLERHQPLLLLENNRHTTDVEAMLEPLGYQGLHADAGRFVVGRGEINTFYAHRRHRESPGWT